MVNFYCDLPLPVAALDFPYGYLLLSCLGLVLLVLGLYTLALAKLRFPRHEETRIAPSTLEPAVSERVVAWLERLTSLGFERQELFSQPLSSSGKDTAIIWRMQHPQTGAIAELRSAHVTAKSQQTKPLPKFTLNFLNFLSDGRFLVTADKGYVDCIPAHWHYEEATYATVEQQWDRHNSRLIALGPEATPVIPADPIQSVFAEHQASEEAGLASGLLQPAPENPELLRISPRKLPGGALRSLRTLFLSRTRKDVIQPTGALIGPSKTGALPPPLPGSTTDTLTALVDDDLQRYTQTVGSSSASFGLRRAVMIGATLFLYYSLWQGLGIIQMALALLGIRALHELGHWAAMRAFGTKDPSLFLIPRLSRTLPGTQSHPKAWQEFIILLSGPLPGILLGLGVLIWGYFQRSLSSTVLDLGMMSITLNALTLLPILPLDGGRILDLLIFKDTPYLRVLFSGISAILVFIGASLSGVKIFVYLALGLLWNLVNEFKQAKIVKEAKKLSWAGQETDESTALRRLFSEIRTGGNANYAGSLDWIPRTQTFLAEAMRRRPSWTLKCGGLATYGVLSALAIALISLWSYGKTSSRIPSVAHAHIMPPELRTWLPTPTAPTDTTHVQPTLTLAEATAKEWTATVAKNTELPFPEIPKQLARSSNEDTFTQVKALHWPTVAALKQSGEFDPILIDTWLHILRIRSREAMTSGQHAKAAWGAEMLLHALATLEPATSHNERTLYQSTQQDALLLLHELNALGTLIPAAQKRITARIQALRRQTDPAIEAYLLVDGWETHLAKHTDQTKTAAILSASAEPPANAYHIIYDKLGATAKEANTPESTPVLLAKQWHQNKKAHEFPAQPPTSSGTVTPAEQAYLRSYRSAHRDIDYLQRSFLWVLSLEAHRRQHGTLPPELKNQFAGGGVLQLLHGPQPVLRLSDGRAHHELHQPAWLGKADTDTIPSQDFALAALPSPASTASTAKAPTTPKKAKRKR